MQTLGFERFDREVAERCSAVVGDHALAMERQFPGTLSAVRQLCVELCDCLRDLKDCRNELCLKCGFYKLAHKGACDGCRWKDMGD